jgi:hypothetical protein
LTVAELGEGFYRVVHARVGLDSFVHLHLQMTRMELRWVDGKPGER